MISYKGVQIGVPYWVMQVEQRYVTDKSSCKEQLMRVADKNIC